MKSHERIPLPEGIGCWDGVSLVVPRVLAVVATPQDVRALMGVAVLLEGVGPLAAPIDAVPARAGVDVVVDELLAEPLPAARRAVGAPRARCCQTRRP